MHQQANQELPTPSGVVKRPRKESKWKKNVAKRKRNKGEQYVSVKTGNVISAQQMGPACTCKMVCFQKIGELNTQEIFKSYWELGDWNAQTSYLVGHIKLIPVKTRRTNDPNKQRSGSRQYHVTVMQKPIQVCKMAFKSIHGISGSRLDRALKNMTATGMALPDLRGRHASHARVPDSMSKLAIEHIKSFPTVSSHYTRKVNRNAKYLEQGVKNKTHMYELYQKWMSDKHKEEIQVSHHYYFDVLKQSFPMLKFQKPRKDTCKKCDSYKIRVSVPGITEEYKTQLINEHQTHLIEAETAYNMPKLLLERKPNALIVCFDLMKALVTPKLCTGIAFYKRKMCTYNLDIHNYRNNKGHMFMWDEVTAKRGAVEIISALNYYIEHYVDPNIEEIIFFSDNCPGQNKNYSLMCYYMYLIHLGKFKRISHIYFQTGHSYMAADRDFGLIEKLIKDVNYIFTPGEYADIIKNIKKDPNCLFNVTIMDQTAFKDWDILMANTTRRKCHFNFSSAVFYKFTDEYKLGYGCGTSYTSYLEDSETRVKMSKGRSMQTEMLFDLTNINVPQKYTSLIPLDSKKLEDIKLLVSTLVPPEIKEQYWDRILNIVREDDGGLEEGVENIDDPNDEDPFLSGDIFDYN